MYVPTHVQRMQDNGCMSTYFDEQNLYLKDIIWYWLAKDRHNTLYDPRLIIKLSIDCQARRASHGFVGEPQTPLEMACGLVPLL